MYIKARKEIADYLGLTYTRNVLPDGSYLLYDRDMLAFGDSSTFGTLIPALGCLSLTSAQARDEQQGKGCLELPYPTDERAVCLISAEKPDKEEEGGADV